MDTIRLKMRYERPNTLAFSECVKVKDLDPTIPSEGNRFVYTNNSIRKELKNRGQYVPKYWIEEHYLYPDITYLVIELSIAKMLFGQNVTEVKLCHYDEFLKNLQKFLSIIGVNLSLGAIELMEPTLIAFGKNIDMSSLCSVDTALNILSPFNDRFRSEYRQIYFENDGGKELYFSNPNSTFKVYDKVAEMLNRKKRTKEEESFIISHGGETMVREIKAILRFELTLKKKQEIQQRVGSLKLQELNLKSVFLPDFWAQILREEVAKVYNHPIKEIILLAQENQPLIERFLKEHCRSTKTRDTVRGITTMIQEKGLRHTRLHYQGQAFKSRQTWYNYVSRIQAMWPEMDFSVQRQLTSARVLQYVLNEFEVDYQKQQKLNI